MEQNFCYTLKVAGITIKLTNDQCLKVEKKYNNFLTDSDEADFDVVFKTVHQLPKIIGGIIHEEMNYCIFKDDFGRYYRTFCDLPRDDTPYCVVSYDYDHGRIQVDYLEKGAHCVSEMGNSFGHLNFEELLLRKGRLCLHASCVDTLLGGILFSGPSGIGKSTQSDLWCHHRGTKLINGDRPILSKNEDGWLAWGSPYAGSSKCHINENCSVRAIVMLKKATQCSIRRLSGLEAFRSIWSGLTVHSWDENYVTAAIDLAQELAEKIPVYELSCTPDEQAVLCLEEALGKERG